MTKPKEVDFSDVEKRLMIWAYEIEAAITEAFGNVLESADPEYIHFIKTFPPDEVAEDLIAYEGTISCLSPLPTEEDLIPFIIKWRKEHG